MVSDRARRIRSYCAVLGLADLCHHDRSWRRIDGADLAAFLEAHALYDVVWQAYEGRRRPRAQERAAASLRLWRETLMSDSETARGRGG